MLFFIMLALSGWCFHSSSCTKDPSRPNIVFILADDWGWGDISAYHENSLTRTPRLDALASEGTMFTDFHVANPVCSPSRTAFMTGQHPSTLRVYTALTSNAEKNKERGCANFVNSSTPTITKLLKESGYVTGHFGKWHLGWTPDAPPPNEYGIDVSATYCSTDSNRLPNCSGPPGPGPGPRHPCPDAHWPGRSSQAITQLGIEFIKNASNSQKPFYLNLWFHISHAPLNLLKEQLQNFSMSSFCRWSGMTPDMEDFTNCPEQIFRAAQHDADYHIGQLLDFLDKNELSENTLVVFSADNGPEDVNVYFNSVGSTGPFRGRKRSLYEGGIRTPFIARWPGKIPAKQKSNALLSGLDWLPTVAKLTGTAISDGVSKLLVGQDMSELLLSGGKTVPERKLKLKWDWRFGVTGDCWNEAPRLAIRDGDMKLLMNTDGTRAELYNLTACYFEGNNIAADQPDIVKRLSEELSEWAKSLPDGPVTEHLGCQGYKVPTF